MVCLPFYVEGLVLEKELVMKSKYDWKEEIKKYVDVTLTGALSAKQESL